MAKSLVDVMDEILKENPLFKEEDIKNAVNTAQKSYQPEPETEENLVKIKDAAIATLDFSSNL